MFEAVSLALVCLAVFLFHHHHTTQINSTKKELSKLNLAPLSAQVDLTLQVLAKAADQVKASAAGDADLQAQVDRLKAGVDAFVVAAFPVAPVVAADPVVLDKAHVA